MAPFSLGFLLPLLLREALGHSLGPARWGLVLLPFGPWGRRWDRHRLGFACGAALFLALPSPPPPRPSLPSGPCRVEARCAGEPRALGRSRWLIPLEGAPPLLATLPTPPLPGTTLRFDARVEPEPARLVLPPGAPLSVVSEPRPWHPGTLLSRLRRWCRGRFARGPGGALPGHLRALVLGERSLPRPFRRLYQRTGTLHLFAISGLHLGLLLAFLEFGLGRASRGLAPSLFVYAALTGFHSPVGRALVLALGRIGARRFARRPRERSHLLLAGTFILALHPEALHEAGFQLSFACYLGIRLTVAPWMERRARDPFAMFRRRLPSLIEGGLMASLGAFLFGLPVTLLHFHQVVPATVPASLLLAPLLPPLLLLGLLWLVFPGSPLLVLVGDALLALVRMTLEVFEALPGACILLPTPHPATIVLYLVLLGLWVRSLHRGRKVARTSLLLLLGLPGLAIPADAEDGLFLLDARRGTALLVRTHEKNWLIDTGPARARVSHQLLDRGIGSLEGVLLSHPHQDHCGGLPDLEESLRIRRVLGSPHGAALLRDQSFGSPGARLRVLWPPDEEAAASAGEGPNDRSAAFLVEGPAGRLLSLGDLESEGLEGLLRKEALPRAAVAIAPHHGSRNRALPAALLDCGAEELWISSLAEIPDDATLLLTLWSGVSIRRQGEARRRPP